MYRLIIKDVRLEHQSPCTLHIYKNLVRLSPDCDVRCLAYLDRTSKIVYIFFTSSSPSMKEWRPPQQFVALPIVDDRYLNLESYNLGRYDILGSVDATIEHYSTERVDLSVAKNAHVCIYLSGSQKIRASVRSSSSVSVCGTARSLEICSLHSDSRLDLTSFEGRLFKSEHDVFQQSIYCSLRLPSDEETSRQRYVREHIRIPDESDVVVASDDDNACIICCEHKVRVRYLPCEHASTCLRCTRQLHTLDRSLFTCPICRDDIQHVDLLTDDDKVVV